MMLSYTHGLRRRKARPRTERSESASTGIRGSARMSGRSFGRTTLNTTGRDIVRRVSPRSRTAAYRPGRRKNATPWATHLIRRWSSFPSHQSSRRGWGLERVCLRNGGRRRAEAERRYVSRGRRGQRDRSLTRNPIRGEAGFRSESLTRGAGLLGFRGGRRFSAPERDVPHLVRPVDFGFALKSPAAHPLDRRHPSLDPLTKAGCGCT
jgi:hypothetical protein